MNVVHLAIPADDRYWRQALVTAASAVRSSSLPVVVHILDGGISDEHKKTIVESIGRVEMERCREEGVEGGCATGSGAVPQFFPSIPLHGKSIQDGVGRVETERCREKGDEGLIFHPLDMAKLSKYGQWHGSAVAWSRLWLSEILPADLDWVISCDADVLFRGDIAELRKLRDEGVSIVASQDRPLPNEPHAWVAMDWYKEKGLEFKVPASYFCDGLCLCNLKKWREIGAQEKFVALAAKYSDWPSPDQMIINYVLQDDKKLLPRNWGCFSGDQNADVDYNGNCAIHYVNDQPWERRKLTHLVSDVILLWWREAGRVQSSVFRVQSSVFRVQSLGVYGCRNWADFAWRRGIWLVLRATSGLWRHFDGFAWHFRNALPRPKNSKLQTLNSKLSSLRLVWWTRGANTHHTTLLTALRARGVDVEVCYYHGRYSSYRLQMGWKDPELKHWEHYASTIRAAKKIIPDFSERVQMVAGYSDAVNWKTMFWCLLHRKPWFVVTEGSSGSWKSRPVFKLFAWLVNRFALALFALGRQAAEQFHHAGIRSEKILLFYYATLQPPKPSELSKPTEPGPCVFVYAGEFCRRKGVDVLAAAWKKVHAQYPNTRLVVAGGDVVKDVDTSFLSGEGVEYVGAVPQEKIYEVICRGDVMVLPSRYDPWGVALVEGAAAGLAMIGSDKTGAALELIKEGENGYLVKAAEVDVLAEAMSRYAANPSLAKVHGIAAKEAAKATSGDVLAEKMVQSLEFRV